MSGEWQAESGLGGSGEMVGAVRAPRPSLVSLLVGADVASEGELRGLAAEAREQGLRLGELLVARGLVDEERLGRLVAEQWRLGFLGREQLALDPVAAGLLPVVRARELGGCVLGFREGSLLVVVAEPTSERLSRLREELGVITAGAQVSFAVVSGLLGQLARFHHSEDVHAAADAPVLPLVPFEHHQQEASATAPGEHDAGPREASVAEAAFAEELLADLERATASLEVLRGRVGQLQAAGQAKDRQAAELRREFDQANQGAARLQERVGEFERALAKERQRMQTLRRRLSELVAESGP
jgi:hypothetical protein